MSETLSDSTAVKASTPLEFKNDHLTVKVEILSACLAKVHVSISPQASQAVYAKAIKTVSKEVSLPGFRKGKAPAATILKTYGKSIEKEWEHRLLQTAVMDSIALIPQKPFANDSVTAPKLIKVSREDSSEVSFQLEFKPEVPQINLDEISLKRIEAEPVTDQAIEEEFKLLQFHRATWDPIPDRAAEEGDYVDLTIISLDPPTSTLCQNARFMLQKDKMSAWMHKLIIGLKPGETVEGTSEKDANTNDPDDAFVPTRCSITLESINQATLPEINEEFAKRVGTSSLEDLKEKVRHKISKVNANNAWKAMEGQVIQQLLTKYPFEIPERECEEEKKIQYERLQNKLANTEGSPAEKVKMIQDVEQYISSLPNSYRLFFMARQLAKNFHIRITEKELSDEITHHLLLSRTSYDTLVDESMDPRHIQLMIYNHLLLHKAIEYIVKNAQVTE